MSDQEQLLLKELLKEIKEINTPNLSVSISNDIKDIKEDIGGLKYTLLDPETGIIVKTNKNTEFRQKYTELSRMQDNTVERIREEVKQISLWKASVTKALWILYSVVATAIGGAIYALLNALGNV